MTLNNNPYITLGVENNCTQYELKKSYLKLVKKYHPDSGDTADNKKFNSISKAYDFLNDNQNKTQLDEKLKKESEIETYENNFESDNTHDLTKKENYSKWKNKLKKASNKQDQDELKDT